MMKKVMSSLLCTGFLLAAGVQGVHAERLFAVDTNNTLLTLSSNLPGSTTTVGAITGLQAGETLLGIDFRPATNLTVLYGIGSSNRLYVINTVTAAATEVTGGAPFALQGQAFGVGFNPVPDRLRVVSDAGQNLRLNPNNGGLAATDTSLAFAAGDPNAGQTPHIVAADYTNSFGTATTTTLYDIDSTLDILVRQGGINVPPGTPSPNTGQLFTVGALGVDTSDIVGFDISGNTGTALAALTVAGSSELYTIDLTTGRATLVGDIGDGSRVITGLAVAAVPEPSTYTLWGLGLLSLLGYVRRRRLML